MVLRVLAIGLACVLGGCLTPAGGETSPANGEAIRKTPRDLTNQVLLDGRTRVVFGEGSGPVQQVILEPCRLAMMYRDGSWTRGEWAALGHDGMTGTGTLMIEPTEAGVPSGIVLTGPGFGVELWGYRLRFTQTPAEEPNTVYRVATGLDLVTLVTGDVPDRFGQQTALTRLVADPATLTDGDLACLPEDVAAEIRSRAAQGL